MTRTRDVDVTVSIVNHENRDAVLACLKGLEEEADRRAVLQVVVVDNASEDGSGHAIRRDFPWVDVVQRQRRDGFGAGHNLALHRATGRYVLMLNDDTLVCPGAIDALAEVLDRDPRVAVVAPRVIDPAGNPQATAWRSPSPALDLLSAATLGRAPGPLSHGSAPRRVGWAMGCALLARRGALLDVGGFDESYFMYSEEIDLSRRLANAGFGTVWVPTATVVHEGHVSTGGHGSPARAVSMGRARRRYWARHYSPGGRLVAQCSTSLMFIALALSAAAGGREWKPFWLQARESWADSSHSGLREQAAAWNAAADRAGLPS